MMVRALAALLTLAGLVLLLWAVFDYPLQGYTTAPLGGLLPGAALICAGVLLWKRRGV